MDSGVGGGLIYFMYNLFTLSRVQMCRSVPVEVSMLPVTSKVEPVPDCTSSHDTGSIDIQLFACLMLLAHKTTPL